MNTEKFPAGAVGFGGAFVAVFMDHVLGAIVALLTIVCLIPVAIRRWKDLFYDYKYFCAENRIVRGVRSFSWFLWLFSVTKAKGENTDAPSSHDRGL